MANRQISPGIAHSRISLEQMTKELAAYLRGWKSYFGFCQTPSLLKEGVKVTV